MHHQNNKCTRNNQGVSLIIAVLVMSLILTIMLAISSTFIGEIQNSRIFEKSTQAFYAADSGAEAVLFNQRKNLAEQLSDGSGYQCSDSRLGGILFEDPALDCEIEITGGGQIFQILGKYNTNEAQRKVEVRY